jgi:hypothetical protein
MMISWGWCGKSRQKDRPKGNTAGKSLKIHPCLIKDVEFLAGEAGEATTTRSRLRLYSISTKSSHHYRQRDKRVFSFTFV